ncbi:isoamylase early set domain-containing protein [Streptacidiphilus carbonis]|jgi:1,4-alpha-glucan branching enzyme|uniref:isoamylase early set domain-containing protein n=1 Tax=Streptacidiphilus carbonis TaxID=105422 RepID=UPI0005AA8F71|nr:isoamylase early set domain-containing protein [Streptacidiphilus carbonis]
MLERSVRKARTEITFVLPPDHPAEQVSVVGDFNDWRPGSHALSARPDGSRAVKVALPNDGRFEFRYLAYGDYWFDEADADGHNGRNSYLHT